MHINLYTGPQCSLCDDAKSLLDTLPENIRPQVTQINIRDDVNLYHAYAVRIPVLKRTDNQQELGWPFDQTQLIQFLS
ncbi:glutaredoxin family protein [Alteromonas sediminis]|uniref:Glutaredoxin family protein n=1 Tax=Alteromonas sediminis TaxID=2259342 RepID=A0A3N5Y2R3_9ALTE|nr:glutaredoxin family protein [Alteromonas sediminis]RPJ67343.1 glutaredoxin family protein [Alteromonas sediminis]